MKKFSDFVKSYNNSSQIALKDSQGSANIAVARTLGSLSSVDIPSLPSGKVDELASQITKVAYSKEFIGEFSDAIGLPKQNETEDQFVKRAKEQMSSLLQRKLKK